jgi:perosamine synthetase
MPRIGEIAARRGLKVIEDSCEAIGASIGGRPAGSFGDSGAFAFYPNKQVTTGEGGALVTSDEETARLARSWRNQGRGEGAAWLQHDRLGYNYRLSDINCALGLGQLSRLDSMLAKRSNVGVTYDHLLADVPGVILPPRPCPEGRRGPQGTMSWFVYVIRLADEFSREQRDQVLTGLRSQGVACSNYFAPIHLQSFYREQFGYRPGQFPVTEHVSDRTIALPFFTQLRESQVDRVVTALRRALHSARSATVGGASA